MLSRIQLENFFITSGPGLSPQRNRVSLSAQVRKPLAESQVVFWPPFLSGVHQGTVLETLLFWQNINDIIEELTRTKTVFAIMTQSSEGKVKYKDLDL